MDFAAPDLERLPIEQEILPADREGVPRPWRRLGRGHDWGKQSNADEAEQHASEVTHRVR
jgi:hypothetical protein